MPRTFSVLTNSNLEYNLQEFYFFIKVVFPSITLRFTNRPGGFVGNIDGSTQTWVEEGIDYSPISQKRSDMEAVVWISFPNLDNTWDNYNYNPGILDIPCTIYEGRWNAAISPPVFQESYILYEGRMDDGEFQDIAKINLKPFFNWNSSAPYSKMGGRCTNDFKNPLDCQYVGAALHCEKTRKACRDLGNESHINIYDDMPSPGETIMYGGKEHGLITKQE